MDDQNNQEMSGPGEKVSRRSLGTESSIAERVWLAIGILLFLFFVTSTVAHLLTQRIDSEVTQLVRAAELVLNGSGETEAANLAQSLADWRAKGTIDLAVWFLLSMTLFGVIVGISAAIALSRGLIRPIIELAAGAEAIGEGRLDRRIAVNSDDEMGALAESFNLMAEKRQQIEAALRDQAHHDTLTKLPNRTLFHDRFAQALALAKRYERRFALHFLDLDGFKAVNDSLGHLVGDELLRAVATVVTGCIRTSDTAARFGGDEFAVIQTEFKDRQGAVDVAERIIGALSQPLRLGDHEVRIGVTIGIAVFPEDGADAAQLQQHADLALYVGKAKGKNTYVFYDSEMSKTS